VGSEYSPEPVNAHCFISLIDLCIQTERSWSLLAITHCGVRRLWSYCTVQHAMLADTMPTALIDTHSFLLWDRRSAGVSHWESPVLWLRRAPSLPESTSQVAMSHFVDYSYPRHRGTLSDTAIHSSVCLSVPWRSCPRRAVALGYRHAGCLQLSHCWPPEMVDCSSFSSVLTDGRFFSWDLGFSEC